MANTPTDPHDPARPAPKTRPPSLSDSDWFVAIPELPKAESGKMPSIPTEADIDIESIFAAGPAPRPEAPSKVAPASGWLTPGNRDLPVTPATPSEDAEAEAEGSDIFSSGRRRPRGGSNAFRLDDTHDTDPVNSASGYSNIFDEPAAPSGGLAHFFKGNADGGSPPDAGGTTSLDGALDGGPTPSDDDLFLAFDQPPSELFSGPDDAALGLVDDDANAVNDLMDELHLPFAPPAGGGKYPRPAPYGGGQGVPPGPAASDSGLDFNETAEGASSSNLFADLGEIDAQTLNSGVDLLNPDGVPAPKRRRKGPADGTDSAIFPKKRAQGSSLVNMDDLPPTGSADEPTEAMLLAGLAVDLEGEATSDIFKRGERPAAARPPAPAPDSVGGDKSSVSFGSPSRHGRIVSLGSGQAGAASDDATSAIDWALPGDSPSNRPALRPTSKPPARRVDDEDDDGNADLTGRDDGVEPTARMAPSSGIFDIDTSRESPLGSLSGFFPAGPKSGFTPPASGVRRPAGGQSPTPRSNARLGPTRPDVKPTAKPVAKSGLGWRAGAALGLAAGVLGGVAATALGVALLGSPAAPGPSASGTPAAPVAVAARPSAEAALTQARTWLAAGEPELALAAFEAAGDAASPLDIAGRGQARWLVRVRAAAKAGEAVRADDAAMRPALADLERTVASADLLQTPDEKRALIGAVLRLGLTKELSGDLGGAAAYYADAAARYPESQRLFEASVKRTRLMRGQGKLTLTPRDAAGLVEVALMAVLLVQGDAVPSDAGAAEPGVLFWEAANRAATNDYAAAVTLIGEARAAHDARRLTLAGRGLNPLSDPVEQIFLKCCDELAGSWTLRRQLYSDPVAGAVFAKSGVAAGLKQIAAAAKPDPKVAEQLATAQADLKKAATELAAANAKALDLDEKLTTATGEVAVNVKAKDAALAEALDAAKVAKAAKDKLTAAESKLASANDVAAKVVGSLKAAKVVGPDEDADAVLKNLPDILKKVATASDSGDAKKAAAALAAARTEVATARAEAAATATKLTAVEAQLKKADENAALTTKSQLDAQKAASDAKLDAVARDAKRQVDDAVRRLADARAGAVVPLMTSELVAQGQAAGLYTRAIDLYFTNRFADAEVLLTRVVNQDPADARYWYFLGLAQLAQGKPGAAEAFQKGAEQEARSLPPARDINVALEKVQGSARQTLNSYRRR